jgi:endonuclease III related protein
MSGSSSIKIEKLVHVLATRYGDVRWWPGDADEVMIGAILTQQTRWENVEHALAFLQKRNLCTITAIMNAEVMDIEDAIRCTGFYRMKARRLKSLASHIILTYGGVGEMAGVPTDTLRKGLLNVPGIGDETADSILCYGLLRTSFVIDAYTDRIVRCMGVTEKKDRLKGLFEQILPLDNHIYKQTHAHIVEYAKEFCGKKRCAECILVSSSV